MYTRINRLVVILFRCTAFGCMPQSRAASLGDTQRDIGAYVSSRGYDADCERYSILPGA